MKLPMLRLPVAKIIEKIQMQERFEAVAEDYSFTIKIDQYVPYICAAVHDGHQFRKSLWSYCLHSEYERWYEEDPCTKQMIAHQPIVLAGCDSRFEYDLNRSPETAIYEDAWGKRLWKDKLPEPERALSLEKHRVFYYVVRQLVQTVENLFGKALVFDMHSYNWQRWEREVPVWNLGTANVDNERFGQIALEWSTRLGTIFIPNGVTSTSAINDTFQGNGYFLKYITQNFSNTLVLATEIAKIYCDEKTAIIFPEVVRAVRQQLQDLIPLQAKNFMENTL